MRFAPVPPATAIPTLSSAIIRLTQSLNDLTTSHTEDVSSLNSLAEEGAQLDIREAEIRQKIGKAEEKRSWFVAFREWVESVATFLDDKVCTCPWSFIYIII
jgi:GC-rich sequence DNA-binding factor